MRQSQAASLELIDERIALAVGRPQALLEAGRLSVRPGSAAEIADIVRIATEVGLPVGVSASSGLSIDLSRMCNVLHLDETSLLASVQAGVTAQALENQLATRGLTLGPLPLSSRQRTVGALVAAPRPSEAHPRAGRFVQQVCGVAGLLPDGTEISTRVAPRKATGPDLLHALVGGRGALGLITAATIRLYRRGEVREDAAFRFVSVEDALRAARALLVAGGRPLDLWVSPPGLLSLTVDGAAPHAAAERELAERVARAHAGEPAPFAPPAPIARAPHERAVSLERIEAAVPSPRGRVVGWHVAGAAVIDPDRAPDLPAAHPLTILLKRRLDPDRRFPDWPGA